MSPIPGNGERSSAAPTSRSAADGPYTFWQNAYALTAGSAQKSARGEPVTEMSEGPAQSVACPCELPAGDGPVANRGGPVPAGATAATAPGGARYAELEELRSVGESIERLITVFAHLFTPPPATSPRCAAADPPDEEQ